MKSFHLRRRIIVAWCLLLASSAQVLAQSYNKDHERNSPAILKVFREVVAKPSESAGAILCNGKNAALGAIVDADGLILTKNTLLIGEISCKLKDGRVFPAEVLGEHDGSDLALLKIPAKELVPVKWRPSRELKQAMWLASVAPGPDPLAIGVVGVATRNYQPGDQPDAPGPKSGYLGVQLEEAGIGAKIKSLAPNSPALKAGLKVGDIIVQAGTRPVTSIKSLQSAGPRPPALCSDLMLVTGRVPACTMMSPTFSPALSAGLFGASDLILAPIPASSSCTPK